MRQVILRSVRCFVGHSKVVKKVWGGGKGGGGGGGVDGNL